MNQFLIVLPLVFSTTIVDDLERGEGSCLTSALRVRASCNDEVNSKYLSASTACRDHRDGKAIKNCLIEARTRRFAEIGRCRDDFDERNHVCKTLTEEGENSALEVTRDPASSAG